MFAGIELSRYGVIADAGATGGISQSHGTTVPCHKVVSAETVSAHSSEPVSLLGMAMC